MGGKIRGKARGILIRDGVWPSFMDILRQTEKKFERLASVGIMEAKSRAPLKPLNTMMLLWSEGFQGEPPISIGPPGPVSRTAVRLFAVFFFSHV